MALANSRLRRRDAYLKATGYLPDDVKAKMRTEAITDRHLFEESALQAALTRSRKTLAPSTRSRRPSWWTSCPTSRSRSHGSRSTRRGTRSRSKICTASPTDKPKDSPARATASRINSRTGTLARPLNAPAEEEAVGDSPAQTQTSTHSRSPKASSVGEFHPLPSGASLHLLIEPPIANTG